jgi:hypothetical protein
MDAGKKKINFFKNRRLKMIDFVERAVSKFPELSCKMNIGDRLRIMKDGWQGSLWATYKKNKDKYRFLVTGDVDSKLAGQFTLLFGKYNLETRDYKYWYLDKIDVEKILKTFAHTF